MTADVKSKSKKMVKDKNKSAADLLIDRLIEWDVEYIFGLPEQDLMLFN